MLVGTSSCALSQHQLGQPPGHVPRRTARAPGENCDGGGERIICSSVAGGMLVVGRLPKIGSLLRP